MALLEKAKEKVVENLVQSGLLLIALLGLVLWSAVPTTFWQGISDAVEKRVLWAVIGLFFLAIVGLTIYIGQAYMSARRTLHHFSGVLWNNNCDFFCPKDETPLFQAGRTSEDDGKSVEIFQCPKCDSNYIFKDSEGEPISVAHAKKAFLTRQSIGQKGSVTPMVVEGIDDNMKLVLQGFAGTTTRIVRVDQFTGLLKTGLKPAVISYCLDKLHKKGFLKRTTYTSNHPDGFELTEQGREYIVENSIL